MRRFLFLFLGCFVQVLYAQPDSSLLLKAGSLSAKDILPRSLGQQKLKAISATRSLEEIDQLPFSVWVVTAEDISRNGFVTLGDVLRAAPGVRVSQPGNTLEGETFMVRGLSGNQYMKVMINDVPVQPAAAPGMPIGAQLPVRQAERIEIFFGPAAAIYGEGACAGVVNIILKETERPIFTQADLAFGNFDYNSLDLMLGGKLFKDQKIFRFSLYGSSTVRGQSDIYYDDNLYAPNNYLPFGLDSTIYRYRQNYRPRDVEDTIARTAPAPHESRLLGINLTWRGIQFNYNRLQRFDHSSLGLSPLAVSYGNPSNRIAERIETFAIRFQKRRTHRTATNTISLVRYKVDNTSTFTPIFDRLSSALYYTKIPDIRAGLVDSTFVLDNVYQRYDSDERYFVASDLDIRFESRIDATLRPNLYLNTGVQVFGVTAALPGGYFIGPTQINILGDTDPQDPHPFDAEGSGDLNVNLFSQLQWYGKKLTLIGGIAGDVSITYGANYAPRLALAYRLDSAWSIRGTYAEAFRRPTFYSFANTYSIDAISRPFPIAEPTFGTITDFTERTRQAELSVRRVKDDYFTEVLFFYQEGHNLLRNGYLINLADYYQYGYANSPGLGLALWGVQGKLGNDLLSFDLNLKNARPINSNITAKIEYYFQYSRGREWFGYGLPATNDVRNFPRWISQFRLSLRGQKWDFMISSNRQNAILSSAVVYRDFYQRQRIIEHYPAYRTWDFMIRVYLSKNFLLYLQGRNILNKHHAGIDATGTSDDLLYNPQQGRLMRFGVNYNMN